jgi:cyanophycin synthetase
VLEARAPACATAAALAQWARLVAQSCVALDWPAPAIVARPHAGGATLAFAAPVDQLFAATEVNELAWQRACGIDAGLHAPGFPSPHDGDSARHCLAALARAERRPDLTALLDAAARHGLPFHLDDERLSLGEGEGSQAWPLAALPTPDAVDWPALHAVPKALVTGSNGKTTTVRLLAAMCRAHGWRAGHSCTDGLFLDAVRLEAGDYSGPVGARTLLRDPRVQAAVLETARGGILRRGLAVRHADVAVVTNVSADHFGEYGIDSLDDLAATKLAVARVVDARGRLVLNADDPVLAAHGEALAAPVAWFALDDDHPLLRATRARGGATCGVADGQLWLSRGDTRVDLGVIAALPLALGGVATYNIANLAGAALAADGLGIASATIASLLATFGAASSDNPGRMQRWRLGGATVLLDYAHNPEGLEGFLRVATALRGSGRLGLLLGQAGNRPDADIRALARAAVPFAPARIVLKDIDGFLRGRRPGEVPDLLADELARAGVPAAIVDRELREAEAARGLLGWVRDGDVLALPVHSATARDTVVALLDRLQASGWLPGMPVPEAPRTTVGAMVAGNAVGGQGSSGGAGSSGNGAIVGGAGSTVGGSIVGVAGSPGNGVIVDVAGSSGGGAIVGVAGSPGGGTIVGAAGSSGGDAVVGVAEPRSAIP